jgi:hypothetical protein
LKDGAHGKGHSFPLDVVRAPKGTLIADSQNE